MDKQVFVSYARQDRAKLGPLYERLKEAGFRPWMDEEDLLPGQQRKLTIEKALRQSRVVVIGLTESSTQRGQLHREVRLALDLRQEMLDSDIYLIPVKLEPCEIPEQLRNFHWVDLYEESGWPKLRKAIEIGLGKPAEPAPAPAAAGDLLRVRIKAPDGKSFEADVSPDTLVGQLLRDFLDHWSPLSAEGSGHHRYALVSDGSPLDPSATFGESGLSSGAELTLQVERLGPDSAAGLIVEDETGQRFTTTVLLSTPVRELAEAFMQDHSAARAVRVEMAGGPPGAESFHPLNLDDSLFKQGVGDDALLRITPA